MTISNHLLFLVVLVPSEVCHDLVKLTVNVSLCLFVCLLFDWFDIFNIPSLKLCQPQSPVGENKLARPARSSQSIAVSVPVHAVLQVTCRASVTAETFVELLLGGGNVFLLPFMSHALRRL